MERLDANHWRSDYIAEGLEECRNYYALSDPIPNTSAVLFRREVYERVGQADERFQMCGDYKVFAAMVAEGQIAHIVEPLNYYRSHKENVQTRTQAGMQDLAEYFHVMLSIINAVAPEDTLTNRNSIAEALRVLPSAQSPVQRIDSAKRSLDCIVEWNLRNNSRIPKSVMQNYFADWEFALAGRGHSIAPPNRMKFCQHRWRFFVQIFQCGAGNLEC